MSKLKKLAFTFWGLSLVAHGKNKDADQACSPSTPAGSLCKIQILDLHPTQLAVGLIEVKEKEDSLRKKSDSDLQKYELKNPEPAVRGPGGVFYITDHHHLARALIDIHVQETYAQVIADFSNLSGDAFWLKMTEKGWVYPYNEEGQKVSFAVVEATKSVEDLKDDPYRSLAGAVEKQGGFDKTNIDFAEFTWANYFRDKVTKDLIYSDFDKAIEEGMRWAQSPDASALPGYKK